MEKQVNFGNRFNREIWIKERRDDIRDYYHSRNLVCQKIPEQPLWSSMPFTSIWLIKAVATPGFHGWYVIAGDHPTDIVGMGGLEGPQDALLYFGRRWLQAAKQLKEGEAFPDFRIERIEDRAVFGAAIGSRALRILEIAETL